MLALPLGGHEEGRAGRNLFVKGKTLGSLAACSLAESPGLRGKGPEFWFHSVLPVCLAWSEDRSSLTHLLPRHLVDEAEVQ